jgi:hypothetical protein
MSDLKRIEEKLDVISEKIGNIDITLVEVKKDLGYHIKRTDLLEEHVKPAIELVEEVRLVKKIGKFLIAIGVSGAGIAKMVAKILHSFYH